jgi:biopolymer transport protein ExbB
MTNLIVVRTFFEGGWVMYPMLATSIIALSVILERFTWWLTEERRRERGKLEEVYAALEKKDVAGAAQIAGSSKDAVLRVLWFGLSQQSRSSLQGAFQVAAGIELERAGRFVVALDTIVTLAPLLGLLGTVTGLMKAFFKFGAAEVSEEAIGGGIAEALIATACGLSIAATCLIFLNYYASKVTRLQFELQTACGKAEVLLDYRADEKTSEPISSPMPEATETASLTPPSLASPEAMNPPTI